MLLEIRFWIFVELIASIAVLLPIIIGSKTIRKGEFTPFLVIMTYCIIYAVFEVIGWYYVLNHWHNHFLQNTMSYLDIIFLGLYFYLILEKRTIKIIVLILVIVTLTLTLWSHIVTGRDYNRLDSFALSVGGLSLIAMSLLFFYQLLNNLDVKNIFEYSHFWITCGILIFFSGAFFTFIFSEYIAFSLDKNITQYFQISAFLLFIQRIFLAIGLWFSKTPPQLSPSSK
jgi:hypothetical protein